ncbi:hypothetical protein MGYG_03932 [Nannizzia gypsea CBS 118893]|uniref:DUF8035 domain-containing protein n=1 Tax=Arthroderma gypseum (strain ATCC MYA-4604 / CBS 118893) TaxID=535722 RepID=E4UUG4_ARTGP|nr:hypothetical protein MGYG_03932 [Nannizzia gypsea CBS 118893]EFR00931.1 hypothetical protein MGYG_03932 [Nannizzia gypsea CBS 118893]
MASQDSRSGARRSSRVSGGREIKLPPTYTVDGRTYTAGPEMRPRSHTISAEGSRISLNSPSSPGRQPVVTTIKPRSQTIYPSSSRDGGERYITPSSSHSRNRQSTGPLGGEREAKYRNGYLTPAGNSGFPSPGRDANNKDIDVHDSFSYTNAREQFYRDSDAIREFRRQAPAAVRKARPLSLTGLEAYLPQITRDPKPSGPPTSSRRFPGSERDDAPRNYREIKPRDVDTDSSSINPSGPRTPDSTRRKSSLRNPVSLHQDRTSSPSPAPASRRSGYDDSMEKGYQIRRDANNNVIVDDKPETPRRDRRLSVSGQTPNRDRGYSSSRAPDRMMSGGLATAGLASGYSKEPMELSPRPGRDRPDYPSRPEDKYKSSSRNWPQESNDGYYSDGARGNHMYKPSPSREAERHPRAPSPVDSDSKRSVNSQRNENFAGVATRESNPPAKRSPPPAFGTSPDTQAPRGILKQPTEKFPEEPHAVREGVAPLKDTQKKGVPAGARWTKIDRRLVSPSALEGRERFEERPDYVIVLRVLSREEIEEYALSSAKIRASRTRRITDRKSRDDDDNRTRVRDTDSDEDDDRSSSQLRLEPPPRDPRR